MSNLAVLLDSSVIIALLDPEDAHHPRARQLLEQLNPDDVLISVLTLAEILVGAVSRGETAVRTAEDFLREAAGRVKPVTERIARRGARLRASHSGLRLTDALIIATGEEDEVGRILTADSRWVTASQRVELVA